MSEEDEITVRDLSDEDIEKLLTEGAAERQRRQHDKLKQLPWGKCECGKEFNQYDKLLYNFCPLCGAELDKDE